MHNPKEKKWEITIHESTETLDSRNLLASLKTNTIGAATVKNFFSKEELDVIIANIHTHEITWYPNFMHKQGKIGICATEYNTQTNGKALYFASEPEHTRIRKTIFPLTLDPIQRLASLFSDGYETSIAAEPMQGNPKYFAGLVRAMQQKSTVHYDYARHQTAGWWVAEMEVQFAIVIYLQMPENGGELTVYDHPWSQQDDIFNRDELERGAKGFDPAFLSKCRLITMGPSNGDMIIFNSRNFHQVESINPDQVRLTCNVFLGMKNGYLYLWN